MMHRLVLGVLAILPSAAIADDAARARREKAQTFHLRAQERTGVLVPMYVYPANARTNAVYSRLVDLKRRYETVPMWVIVNPASGPGAKVDPNYTTAIDRLRGAGCVVLGYVTTSYAQRPEADVRADVDRWRAMYPGVQGVFFDEMTYADTDAGVKYQAALSRYAHDVGYWPTVANPGADTPGRYFASDAADVILIHEGNDWPKEERLKGDRASGYADYPPFTRGVLVHSMPTLDPVQVRMVRKYARWLYVTEDLYRQNDPKADNPWDVLSKHLDVLCGVLASP